MISSESFAAFRRLSAHLLGMSRTRLELAGVELAQLRQNTVHSVVMSVLAVLLLLMGSVFVSGIFLYLIWDFSPIAGLLICALAYTGAGLWALHRVKELNREERPLFEATLEELKKDKEALLQSLSAQNGSAMSEPPMGHSPDSGSGRRP